MRFARFRLEHFGALVRAHRADDSVGRVVARILRSDLMVIDDIGLLEVGADAAEGLYRLVDAAIGAASRVGRKAGQTVEVDRSGPTMQLTDPMTGVLTRVFLFVGCLPFSRYAFVEPTVDMRQGTWLRAHVAMF
jgi:hypothetical protein